MPNLRQVGTHDTGFWDRENKISADPTAKAQNRGVKEAIAQAKSQSGAELVVIQEDGSASVHALQGEDGFTSENKKILISELDRDPNGKQDLSKTPLAIDDKVAQAFGGKGAFLVDEKNTSTYLGEDVDIATPQSKLQEAEQFLKAPTQQRINAAYAIAEDAGSPAHIDKALGKQVLNDLQSNYRQNAQAAQDISHLRSGDTREKVTALTIHLGGIAGQETERSAEITQTLNQRTQTWQKDNGTATTARDKALNSWNQANQTEQGKVTQTALTLREARMPGVHDTENKLEDVKEQRNQARGRYENAQQTRQRAQTDLNAIEALPASAENHLSKARRLEDDNRNLHFQARNYTTMTLSRVRDDIRRVDRDSDRTSYELQSERSKPPRPANGVSTGESNDPYGKDPFKDNSGGQYRDEGRIRSLESKLNLLRSERRELQSRENGLDRVNTQLAFNQDLDKISLIFLDLSFTDRTALGRFGDQTRRNNTDIRKHEQTAQQENTRYRREVGGARQNLNEANTQEATARSRFVEAEGLVARVETQLDDIKNSPRPDNDPAVKPAFTAHASALKRQADTVGPNAPLTQQKNQTQSRLENIDSNYQQDKQGLEAQLQNVKNTLEGEALQAIAQTRQSLKL